MQVFAHRGYRKKYPENTKIAFQGAVERGVQGIELDVRLTRDGRGVIIHDPTMDRTSDGTGLVEEMSFAEIRALDAGRWFGEGFAGERYLSLESALAILPSSIQLNVHLKTTAGSRESLVEYAVDQIVRHDRLESAFLSCEGPAIELARRIEPRVRGCYLGPHPRNTGEFIEESLSMGCRIAQLPHEQIDVDFVALAHRREVEINALHLDTGGCGEAEEDRREVYRQLIRCGVDGVITDYVDDTSRS